VESRFHLIMCHPYTLKNFCWSFMNNLKPLESEV
jgi:hypothetical protein